MKNHYKNLTKTQASSIMQFMSANTMGAQVNSASRMLGNLYAINQVAELLADRKKFIPSEIIGKNSLKADELQRQLSNNCDKKSFSWGKANHKVRIGKPHINFVRSAIFVRGTRNNVPMKEIMHEIMDKTGQGIVAMQLFDLIQDPTMASYAEFVGGRTVQAIYDPWYLPPPFLLQEDGKDRKDCLIRRDILQYVSPRKTAMGQSAPFSGFGRDMRLEFPAVVLLEGLWASPGCEFFGENRRGLFVLRLSPPGCDSIMNVHGFSYNIAPQSSMWALHTLMPNGGTNHLVIMNDEVRQWNDRSGVPETFQEEENITTGSEFTEEARFSQVSETPKERAN